MKLSTVADLEGLERVCNHTVTYSPFDLHYPFVDQYQAREYIEECACSE